MVDSIGFIRLLTRSPNDPLVHARMNNKKRFRRRKNRNEESIVPSPHAVKNERLKRNDEMIKVTDS